MEIAIKDHAGYQEDEITVEVMGKTKVVVYSSCSRPDTFTYSRDELRHDEVKDAVKELREWLQKHAGRAELASIYSEIQMAVERAEKR
ncbi:MAG TPA: hypothetical protein VK436_05255 [Methanocella sp.]|nr:hypothetical protein [Methanocella sp.]